MDKSSILIIGAGTWGTSIAYQLAKRGHQNIKVLDACRFPSEISAGNDVNKIMEEPESPPSDQMNDKDYAWSTIETIATNIWLNDPTYKPYYHPTGFIYAAVGEEAYSKVEESVKAHLSNWKSLGSASDFKATMPEGALAGDFPGWKGFLRSKRAGWVEARKTMEAVRREAERMGVQFVTGEHGKVESMIFDGGKDIIGAITADKYHHLASCTILSAGANSDRLLDFKKQLRPTAWTLAHIFLTNKEAKTLKDIPVLYGVDRGFFIPSPDKENGKYELKICDEHPGYIRLVDNPLRQGEKRSLPFPKQQIPLEAEKRIRRFLSETAPELSIRPFTLARICWDADTPDRLFLIDRHPEFTSLIVAVGGSGHGFMCSPAVGVLVGDVIEGRIDGRLGRVLGWREEMARERNWWDSQGRFGADGRVKDFGDVEGWTSVG